MPWPKGKPHRPEMVAKRVKAQTKWDWLPEHQITSRLLTTSATTRSIAVEYGCCDATIKKIFRKHTTKEQRLEAKLRKQGESLRGYIHSEEAKANMSRAQTGDKNHFYGRRHTDEFKRQQSERKFGKHTTQKHRIAVSAFQQGISVNEWEGFVTSDNNRKRRSEEYKRWRTEVYERDDYTCQICHQRGGRLHAHHIKPFSSHPELRLVIANGSTLCEQCHREVHKNPAVWVLEFEAVS